MDNIYVYTPVRDRKTFIRILTLFLIFLVVVLALSFVFDWKWYGSAMYIVLGLNSLNVIFLVYRNILDKYSIDENKMTLTIKSMKKVLDIRQISSIERYKTKKGKVKRLLIRVPPTSFFPVAPYNKEEFILHLKKLNSDIQVADKKIIGI